MKQTVCFLLLLEMIHVSLMEKRFLQEMIHVSLEQHSKAQHCEKQLQLELAKERWQRPRTAHRWPRPQLVRDRHGE